MLDLARAQAQIVRAVRILPEEEIPLADAAGRILRQEVTSAIDLPRFDNSSMDGFAVRAADVAATSREKPAVLRVVGRAAAGTACDRAIGPGECVRIFTGAPLPAGADAVVMQEETAPDPENPREIVRVFEQVSPWENVRLRGGDIRAGESAARVGDVLTSGRIALLGALGAGRVRVGRRPRAALIATGDELCEPGEELGAGQIYESNLAALAALARQSGAETGIWPLAPDNLEALSRIFEQAFEQADAVISTGGVSVGEADHVKRAFQQIGGTLEFWRVAIKPGKPFAFGMRGEKLFFGLPGNPVSALLTFFLLARPAFVRMQGAENWAAPWSWGALGEPMSNGSERPHWMRVRQDEAGRLFLAGPQGSHALKAVAAADGCLEVPAGARWEIGRVARFHRWA